MARRIGNTPFVELLPANLAGDPTFRATASALDSGLRQSVLAIPDLLLFARLALAGPEGLIAPLARLAELAGGLPDLPETVLDSLAWQLHVDGYEAARAYDDKRRMVDRSLLLHRRKGTPWAVTEALRALGYADATISEGGGICRYDGEISYNGADTYAAGNRWALFDVEVELGESEGISVAAVQRLRTAVEAWKNVRSHLRAVSWRATMEDATDMDEELAALRVLPELDDVREWGFPLYNGAIRYNNGCFRRYDGALRYGGADVHQFCQPCGHVHDARREAFAVGLAAAQEDAVSFLPRYAGGAGYDGSQRHGPGELPCAELRDMALRLSPEEAISPSEQTAVRLEIEIADRIGVYHDGTLSYGQRLIRTCMGSVSYDGSAGYGPYEGKAVFAVRHDGRARHDDHAVHSLWGWLPGSAQAPLYTYATMSDACVLRASGLGIQDTLAPVDEACLLLRRFRLYNGSQLYSGAVHHDVREETHEF